MKMFQNLKHIGRPHWLFFIFVFMQMIGGYCQSFSEDWTIPLVSDDSCDVTDMVIDELNSEMYIVGGFTGDMSSVFPTGVNGTFDFSINYGGWDGFVAKYDLNGNFIWAFYVGGIGDDIVKAIDLSMTGNIYITGNFENNGEFRGLTGGASFINGSFGGVDIFQASYYSSGLLQWIHEDGSLADDDAVDVKYIEGYNRVVFAGNYYNLGQFGSINVGVANNSFHTFVLGRYDNGLTHWLHAPGGVGDEFAVELAVKNDDVYLIGEFDLDFTIGSLSIPNTNTDDKGFCLKINALGNLDWLTSFSAKGGLNINAADIHSTSNRVFITGSYTGVMENSTGVISSPSIGEDCFLLALNENSNLLSGIKTFHSDLGTGKVIGKSITQLPNNDAVILACDFTDSFQPEVGVTLSSSSQQDGVIMLLSILGDHRGNVQISSASDVDMSNLYLDQNKKLFHSESWSQSLQLENSNFSGTNSLHGAFGRYTVNLPCYFDYPQYVFCADTGLVYIDSVTMEYGNFYNLDGNISINSSTGDIDISSSNSTTGSYVYHQNIGCVDSLLITVIDRFNASLAVNPSEYCQDDLSIDLTSFINGTSGGVWSGANVVGNDLVIPFAQLGVHQFQYEAPVGHFCPSSGIDSVTVNPVFDPSWLGISGNYCSGDADIVLSSLITGDTGGGFLLGLNLIDTLVFADLSPGLNAIRYVGLIGICSADSITTFNVVDGSVNAGMDDSICGDMYELDGSSSQSSVIWTALDTGVVVDNQLIINPSIEVSTPGSYQFQLFAQNGACSYYDTVEIEFLEIPFLNAGLDEIVTIDEASLMGGGNATNINWSTNTLASISQPNDYSTQINGLNVGENEFIIEGDNEFCDALPDTVIVTYQNITIPNAFSPNGDGYNDTFELVGLDTYNVVKVTILTKWGEVLLILDDYQNDWTGLVNNNPLSEGVYFYMIDFDDNQTQGFVEIKR